MVAKSCSPVVMRKTGDVREEMLLVQTMGWRNVWAEMLFVAAFAFVP